MIDLPLTDSDTSKKYAKHMASYPHLRITHSATLLLPSRPILERLGEMRRANCLAIGEIGDCAG